MYIRILVLLLAWSIDWVDGTKGQFYDETLSSVDVELLSFAKDSMNKYFRHQDGIDVTHILRMKRAVDLEKSRQIVTVHFEVASATDNSKYECHVSIYDDPITQIRALIRSVACISLNQDPRNPPLIGGELRRNAQKIAYPFAKGTRMRIEHVNSLTDDEADSYDRYLFETFRRCHYKIYTSDQEINRRFSVFKQNLNRIEQLNAQEQGTAVYGVTYLSDLTEEEFTLHYLNEYLSKSSIVGAKESLSDPFKVSPSAFDWRNLSAVTEVKNQGVCGSCWAFSVTGNIEGVWKVKKGQLISLSEQELVDCDKVDEGCHGGFMTSAYDQIILMSGLESEDDYKYEGRQHNQCNLDKSKVRVTINSYINITSDENEMAEWLANNAPISIGLNANMMQFYFRGIAHPLRALCNPQNLNHGVLLVGYGVEEKRSKTIPFWIIKNSWGAHWGEKGYYRLYRGDGTCGVNLMCSSAVVD